jgi:hypothetical protein
MMKRREFITLLGERRQRGRLRRAQQPRRMGVLLIGDATDPELQNRSRALEAGLRDLGWIDGGNLRINYRWAPDASSVRTQAAELVAARPEQGDGPIGGELQPRRRSRDGYPRRLHRHLEPANGDVAARQNAVACHHLETGI